MILARLVFCTYFFTILLMSGTPAAHQQKSSVTVVQLNPSNNTLEITHRFNIHDVEHALKAMKSDQWDIVADKDAQTNFSRYVQQQFHIKANKITPAVLNYVGHEVEGKFFWIYQQTDITKPLSSISVSHTALQSVWASQVNLVNVEGFGAIKSLRFSKQDNWKNLTLSYP
ncbi:MAG: hypothetical protein P8Q37_05495 [Porticoccaceae bacterium]|nr:hypothetical protein [Porticoccaceae bacterium]MDG1474339.1 hypothetical protein [Porticoccaceae bacterium]